MEQKRNTLYKCEKLRNWETKCVGKKNENTIQMISHQICSTFSRHQALFLLWWSSGIRHVILCTDKQAGRKNDSGGWKLVGNAFRGGGGEGEGGAACLCVYWHELCFGLRVCWLTVRDRVFVCVWWRQCYYTVVSRGKWVDGEIHLLWFSGTGRTRNVDHGLNLTPDQWVLTWCFSTQLTERCLWH